MTGSGAQEVDVRRSPMASEEAVSALLRPVRSGQVASLCLAGGLAGSGVASLAGHSGLAWPALAGGIVAAAGQVRRGRRLRERKILSMGIIGGLSPLLGVRRLDAQTVVLRRWTRGRDSVPARIDLRYYPGIDVGPPWRAEVARVVGVSTGRRYLLEVVDPRHRQVRLRLDRDPPAAAEPTAAQRRLERAVKELMGVTAKTSEVQLDDEGRITGFLIRHDAGAKLAAHGYRLRVERVLGTMLPGRWRAHWDLERDSARFEVRPALPAMAWVPVAPEGDPQQLRSSYRSVSIPFAVDEDGQEMTWRPGVVPHFLVTGQTGMGKTSTSRAVIAGITRNGWALWIADVKQVEFRDLRDWPNVQVVAVTIPQIVAMIHRAHQVMMERYDLVSRGLAQLWEFDPLFLLIDEYTEFVSMLKSWYASVKVRGDATIPPTMDEVASLLRLGRTGRIHVKVTAQRPDVTLFGANGGDMRDNMGQRASLGRLSPAGAIMMWESASVGVSLPRGVPGRMTTMSDTGTPVEAQGYRFPDFDAPERSDEAALLAALRPSVVRHERLLILEPEPVSEDGRLRWSDYAETGWVRAVDRPDLDPMTQTCVDGFDPVMAGSTLGVLGLAGVTSSQPASRAGTLISIPARREDVPSLSRVADVEGATSLRLVEDDDGDDEYGEACSRYAGQLVPGDLIHLPDEDVWVVVDADPDVDPDTDGYSLISWRDDEDDAGVLSWPDGEPMLVRRPMDDTGQEQ